MVKNSLDMWAAFLTRHDLLNKEHLPSELDDPALKKALNVLDVMNFAPEEREAYEEHLKWLRMETSTLKKHETKWFEDGKTEGREEGEQIGIAKGEQIGSEKEKKNMARKLLSKGMSIQEVSELTGLSEDEIKSI
jgi:predicted transposase/invertase (TIGR01784 family)